MTGETSNVHFVDDGSRRGLPQWQVPFPVIDAWSADQALHGSCRVIPSLGSCFAIVRLWHDYALCIWIQENLFRTESQAIRRVERPIDSISVDLTHRHARHKN